MKLKDVNDALEKVIKESFNELSKTYSSETKQEIVFDFWHNARAKDKELNQCFIGVVDVRRMNAEGKVDSFKRLYDRMVVHRRNIGTLENPKYGRQQNYEEARNAVLREIIGKSVSATFLGLSYRGVEQIEEFNKLVEPPATIEESFDLDSERQHTFTITEPPIRNNINGEAVWIVPNDPSIPQEYWGKEVNSHKIVWWDNGEESENET